jgi:hypothetical protein
MELTKLWGWSTKKQCPQGPVHQISLDVPSMGRSLSVGTCQLQAGGSQVDGSMRAGPQFGDKRKSPPLHGREIGNRGPAKGREGVR